MRNSLALMEQGIMTTSETRDGRVVDTTPETIAVYLASVAQLELFIENDA